MTGTRRTVWVLVMATVTAVVLVCTAFYLVRPQPPVTNDTTCDPYPTWSFDYWLCTR